MNIGNLRDDSTNDIYEKNNNLMQSSYFLFYILRIFKRMFLIIFNEGHTNQRRDQQDIFSDTK